ncbi:MAG TPA: Uma2 family endonuclease [Isosphaeraceae bacterium]|nr:Uma2 family endonuclease [Isosphaeraceae bacterium]
MSTLPRSDRPTTIPPLVAGQRLDRATFHERYEAMPPHTRAELIGGVVHMPSPLGYEHADRDFLTTLWLGRYWNATPGLRVLPNATAMLADDSEVQPDLMLLIRPESGGRSRTQDGFLSGSPELVVEIGRSSRRLDLGPKKADYERAGVQEYLFLGLDPDEVRWFILRSHRFEDLRSDEAGVYRSEVFPGLWLDSSALLGGEMNRVHAVLDQGLATPEHAGFVERLRQAREGA